MPELSSAAPAEEIFPVGSNTTRCSVYSGIGVQFPMDSVFSLPRNRCSICSGIHVQLGPEYADWAHYGKLSNGRHHCHIKKGRPTYVAVWEECDGSVNLIEVTYVGTHEKAPY